MPHLPKEMLLVKEEIALPQRKNKGGWGNKTNQLENAVRLKWLGT